MAWTTPTQADVLAALSGPERDAVQTAALAAGQADPVAAALATAVDEARGRIAANRENKLGLAGTIPATVLHHVVAIARWRMLSRLPVPELATETRRGEYDAALAFFRDVAAGRVAIETPAAESDEARPLRRPSISGRAGTYGRASQEGL